MARYVLLLFISFSLIFSLKLFSRLYLRELSGLITEVILLLTMSALLQDPVQVLVGFK